MKKLLLTIIVLLMALLLVYIDEVYFKCPNINKIDTIITQRIDTQYITKDTTIYKKLPVYKNIIKIDTVYNNIGDTILLSTEHNIYNDTITCEEDTLLLKSYIAGINVTRDSIQALWLKRNKILTNTVEVTKYIETRKKLITISPQLGIGYGLINRNIEPYVGVGISINL